jgi:hypothetical protein
VNTTHRHYNDFDLDSITKLLDPDRLQAESANTASARMVATAEIIKQITTDRAHIEELEQDIADLMYLLTEEQKDHLGTIQLARKQMQIDAVEVEQCVSNCVDRGRVCVHLYICVYIRNVGLSRKGIRSNTSVMLLLRARRTI